MTASAELIAAIDELAQDWHVPGGTVVVTSPDGTVIEHAFGASDPVKGRAASVDDLYEIGSISKVACSAVVLQLVDEGVLRLDSPIAELLPWLAGTIVDESITVLRLLQHTAGIVGGIDAVPDELAQALGYALHARETGVRRDPSAVGRFHYSNLGYILLGLASARSTRMPYPRLLEERVLRPAGMSASTAVVTHATRPRLAVGTQPLVDDRAWSPGDGLTAAPFLEVAGADGCIAATGRDLAAFGSALLAADSADGSAILSAHGFRAMTGMLASDGEDVVRLEGAPAIASSRYGLGINVEDHAGERVLTHGGGMVGYASFLAVHLDSRTVVAVVTNANGDSAVAEAIARFVAATVTTGHAPTRPHPARWAPAGFGLGPGLDLGLSPSLGDLRPRAVEPGMTGDFRSHSGRRVSVVAAAVDEPGGGPGGALEWSEGGERAVLHWGWNDNVTTTHSLLRPFPLRFENGTWTWGPERFVPVASAASNLPTAGAATNLPAASAPATNLPTAGAAATHDASSDLLRYVGHYRSYTPWYTNFRVVLRGDELILIAAPGVEAPAEEVVLGRLADAVFAAGSGGERYAFGPVVDGHAAWVDRDGCRYSRAFTD